MDVNYVFLSFVTKKKDGAYWIEPPFDNVNVKNIETGEVLTMSLDCVNFSIEPIKL